MTIPSHCPGIAERRGISGKVLGPKMMIIASLTFLHVLVALTEAQLSRETGNIFMLPLTTEPFSSNTLLPPTRLRSHVPFQQDKSKENVIFYSCKIFIPLIMRGLFTRFLASGTESQKDNARFQYSGLRDCHIKCLLFCHFSVRC